jgi:hypothetical protein
MTLLFCGVRRVLVDPMCSAVRTQPDWPVDWINDAAGDAEHLRPTRRVFRSCGRCVKESQEDIMATSPAHSRGFTLIGFTTILAAAILMVSTTAFAQGHHERAGTLPANPAKIWEDRGPMEHLDLFWGNGRPDRAPVGPFTFLAEDTSGTNPKAHVQDVNGVRWGVKWDEEVHAEVAASRLAWAMGLRVEETYYVDTGTIVFAGGQRPAFQRIGSFIDKQGTFKSPARFVRSEPEEKTKGDWTFSENPLRGDAGYSVLVLMNVIMANWDAKDSNNRLLSVPDNDGITDWYMVADYGACFGKMGGMMSHTKYRLKDFVGNPPVIKSVSANTVNLDFKGQNASAHSSISLAGARFFANRAAELTLAHVQEAFRAAGATDQELQGFAQAVYGRIREVVTKVQGTADAGN